MAVEPRRGCGYRKVGGLYLVGDILTSPCGRLPIELHVCPVCRSGIKQTRGWQWVKPGPLLGERKTCALRADTPQGCAICPVGNPALLGERAGLLWVGGRFYPEPEDFSREAASLGISKRIRAVPRGFQVGRDWVMIAHPRAVKREPQTDAERAELAEVGGTELVRKGIILVFRPQRIEKIVTESMAKDEAAMDALRAQGITPVVVPDDDPDHKGTVYDADDEPELPLKEAGIDE